MADNLTEHQALGEALEMLRRLMIAVVMNESIDDALAVCEANEGKPATWMRAWKQAEAARQAHGETR